jgi:hypothetical protein
MKALVASLQANQGGGGGGGADAERMIAELQAKLAAKQSDLVNTMGKQHAFSLVSIPVRSVTIRSIA